MSADGRRPDAGFSLVELMVSTTVTLLVLGTVMVTLRDAFHLNETATLVSDLSQNMRAALNLLSRELVQAGRGIPTGGIPIPSGNGADPINRPGPEGTAYTFDNVDEVTLPAIVPGPDLGPIVNGQRTDLITILATDATLPSLTVNASPAVAGQPTLAPGGDVIDLGDDETWDDIEPGDLIMFSNALGNALQTVTSIEGTELEFESGDWFNFNQRGAAQGSIMQLRSGGVFPQTTATRVLMSTYFVDNTTTPGSPRLVKRSNAGPPGALAGIVEDLAITFDLVDGDTNPANVSAPEPPNTPHQIRKVNLHVGVRSDTTSQVRQDFLRQHISTVISVRSLAFVDRYE